jgi:hypothetical protein
MSDYLWDKAGAPDAEVERLEELLSAFAHTPRALELPAEAPRRTSATRTARLAVAAALLVAALAGAFVALRHAGSREARHAGSQTPHAAPPSHVAAPDAPAPPKLAEKVTLRTPAGPPRRRQAPRRPRKATANAGEMAQVEEPEGGGRREVAETLARGFSVKAQLVNALRLTGTKLKEVQMKTLGPDAPTSAFAAERNRSR